MSHSLFLAILEEHKARTRHDIYNMSAFSTIHVTCPVCLHLMCYKRVMDEAERRYYEDLELQAKQQGELVECANHALNLSVPTTHAIDSPRKNASAYGAISSSIQSVLAIASVTSAGNSMITARRLIKSRFLAELWKGRGWSQKHVHRSSRICDFLASVTLRIANSSSFTRSTCRILPA